MKMNLFQSMLKYGVLSVMLILMLSFYSCKNDDGVQPEEPVETNVSLNETEASIYIAQELVLIPDFEPDIAPQKTYEWTVANPDIVELTVDELTATVKGLAQGTTTVTIESTDGELSASCEVTVTGYEDDGVLKVLAIGNSFSEDAVENYLFDLAKAAGIQMVIGNAVIGGASLETHHNNISANNAAYSYRKIGVTGEKNTTADVTIQEAVTDENWDFISLQQVSSNSGKYETFETYLPGVLQYVQERATNPAVSYILHQTWAYAQNSTHAAFPDYNSDQMFMYEALVDAIRKAANLVEMDLVVPAGTAIQNGRTSIIGDNFTRDGYHLDFNVGRFTAAATWFEALTGQHVEDIPYKPAALTDLEADIAKYAAHYAVLEPDQVTEMTEYQNAGPMENPIYLQFGDNSAAGWNTIIGSAVGTTNLKDAEGNYTNVSLEITKRFNDRNEVGASDSNTDFNMPAEISSDSFYGNGRDVWQELEIRESEMVFTGLDPEVAYDFCFFSSRMNVSDNRETKFTVTGSTETIVVVNAANNSSEVGCANSITPNESGEVTVNIAMGENNNNSFGFFYLNAMRISTAQ